jgi:hypothetical protein
MTQAIMLVTCILERYIQELDQKPEYSERTVVAFGTSSTFSQKSLSFGHEHFLTNLLSIIAPFVGVLQQMWRAAPVREANLKRQQRSGTKTLRIQHYRHLLRGKYAHRIHVIQYASVCSSRAPEQYVKQFGIPSVCTPLPHNNSF